MKDHSVLAFRVKPETPEYICISCFYEALRDVQYPHLTLYVAPRAFVLATEKCFFCGEKYGAKKNLETIPALIKMLNGDEVRKELESLADELMNVERARIESELAELKGVK